MHRMAYEGNDLLLQITPTRTVRRWADGALTWQVQESPRPSSVAVVGNLRLPRLLCWLDLRRIRQ